MRVSPLTVGVLTGTSELDDPSIELAVSQMIRTAAKQDLETTVLNLTAMVMALTDELSRHTQLDREAILSCVLS